MKNAIVVLAAAVFSGMVMGNAFAATIVAGNVATTLTAKAVVPSQLSVQLSGTTMDFGKVSASETQEAKIDITILKCNVGGNQVKMDVNGAADLAKDSTHKITTYYALKKNGGAKTYSTASAINSASLTMPPTVNVKHEFYGKIVTKNTPIGTYTDSFTVTFSQAV